MSLFRCGGGSSGSKKQIYDGRAVIAGSGNSPTLASPVLNGNGRLLIFAVQANAVTGTLTVDSGVVTLDTYTVTFRGYSYANLCLNTITYSNAVNAVVTLGPIAGRVGMVMLDIKEDTPIITNGTSNQSNHDPVNGSGTIYWIASSSASNGASIGLTVKSGTATLCYGANAFIYQNQCAVQIARYEDAVNAQFTVAYNYCMVIVPD